jgi:hypothetical protein
MTFLRDFTQQFYTNLDKFFSKPEHDYLLLVGVHAMVCQHQKIKRLK